MQHALFSSSLCYNKLMMKIKLKNDTIENTPYFMKYRHDILPYEKMKKIELNNIVTSAILTPASGKVKDPSSSALKVRKE
jgi:hypothetical protein